MQATVSTRSRILVIGACALLALVTAATPARAAYHALLIGVSDYPGFINDLQYCDDDATDTAATLLRYGNWSSANITMLLNSQATRGQIQASLNTINAKMSSGDTFVLLFSGHGTAEPDVAPYDEADGLDEYLVAYDTLIRDDELSSWLNDLRADRIIVLLDSCFSGGMLKGGKRPKGLKTLAGAKSIVRAGDGFARDLINLSGTVALTACAADESSYEFGFLRNGLFAFLSNVIMNRFIDPNSNDLLSAEEIYQGLRRFDRLFNRIGQHPQILDNYSGELTILVR